MTTSNTFEWCNQEVTPQIENLQEIPYEIIPSWKSIIQKEGLIFSQDISKLRMISEKFWNLRAFYPL
ncbi:MAG: hypothetical protein HC830_10390 [Bacteroidetes bacterium]|nr:hypothetical protein [Bacteroidota bacterium]